MKIDTFALARKVTAPLRRHEYKWAGAKRIQGNLYIVYKCGNCNKERIVSSVNEDFRFSYGCTGKE